MKVLQITVHLFPNVGGVETHLNDLFSYLVKKKWQIFAVAYQPLSTKTEWKIFEKDNNLTILRIPWVRGFFEKLVYFPIIEFVYLVPALFVLTPLVIILYRPDVIHAHGLSAAVAAVFWGQLFGIKKIISLHSIYTFPEKGLYRGFVKLLFKNADFVLSLSRKSNQEVRSLGIEYEKSRAFTYWIDLDKFKMQGSKLKIKKELGWEEGFTVLFVGRLIREKGIDVLLESVKLWDRKIKMRIIGSGLMERDILRATNKIKSLQFLGKVTQENLPKFYSGADCLIVPSNSEEGFGRVIIESLACGTPVIASKRGGIDEAMDETVGKFIEVSPESIKKAVYYYYKNPKELNRLSRNTRQFVERRYSERNAQSIIQIYGG